MNLMQTTAISELASSLHMEVTRPRIPQRSQYRGNSGGACISTEGFYRCNVFYPALDTVIADLRLHFGEKLRKTGKLSRLIPSYMTSDWEEDYETLSNLSELYMSLIKNLLEL